MKEKFTEIYKNNSWGDKESVSGAGSRINYTQNLRSDLPELFKLFNIKSVYDAPCGDFNWMNLVVNEMNVLYYGGDIVEDLIRENNKKFSNDKISFNHTDITNDSPPKVDLWICRDCLIHLSYRDILKFFNNFLNSEIKYLLVSSHVGLKLNSNIETGGFRHLDLFNSPFNSPNDVLYRIKDYNEPFYPNEMILLNRHQAEIVRDNLHDYLNGDADNNNPTKAFIITLSNFETSLTPAIKLREDLINSGIIAEIFEGTNGLEAHKIFEENNIVAAPGWEGNERVNKPGVKGCFHSHYRLWEKCVELNEPIFVFEDDMKFYRPFLPVEWHDVLVLSICSHWPSMFDPFVHYLDNPTGEPKAEYYCRKYMPGTSGYAIKPMAAKKLINYYLNYYTAADHAMDKSIIDIQIHNYLMGRSLLPEEGKVSLVRKWW